MNIQLTDCTAMEAAEIIGQLKSTNAGCIVESVRKTRKKYSIRLYMHKPDSASGGAEINGVKVDDIETEDDAEQFLRLSVKEDLQYQ